MNLEEIKNMSDDDFLKLVKDVIKKEELAEIAKENLPKTIKKVSLYADPKEFYRCIRIKNFLEHMIVFMTAEMSVLTVLETIRNLIQNGYIQAETIASKENAIKIACLFFLILPLPLVHSEHKKEKNRMMALEKKLDEDILKLKRSLENFSEKDFEMLMENIKALEETSISDDEIKPSNVVLVANQLIELNATGILNEFETMQAQNESHKNYNDDSLDMSYSKNIKGNN